MSLVSQPDPPTRSQSLQLTNLGQSVVFKLPLCSLWKMGVTERRDVAPWPLCRVTVNKNLTVARECRSLS